MSTFLTFLFFWTVITVLGHGSWVLVRGALRGLERRGVLSLPKKFRPDSEEPSDENKRPSAQEDLPPFLRMVDALTATGQISLDQSERLKDAAQNVVRQQPVADSPSRLPAEDAVQADLSGETPPDRFASSADGTTDSEATSPSVSTADDPWWADSSEQFVGDESQTVAVESPAEESAGPRRPLSETVSAFLARNQIRWGELVAGMLIVVSSVGLVISLWSTLTTAHRVVPSLIFISADAAIFAAGLYTMRRWRLRHTSRAVLIIATLLVPLCVLAGLAAAGTDPTTASLADPVTWVAMLVGTLGVGWLLWQSSLALVGRGDATALAVSVAVPSFCLPLLPAAGRILSETPWGSMSGWFVVLPSLAVATALVWPHRTRSRRIAGNRSANILDGAERTTGKPLTRRLMKNRWLSLAIGVASLVTLFAYAAFLLPGSDSAGSDPTRTWIQIALGSIPAWLAVAAGSRIDANRLAGARQQNRLPQSRWQTTAMLVARTVFILAIGIVLAILPAAIERSAWVWAHGGITALAIVLISFVSKRPAEAIWALVPTGIACCLTSSSWFAAPAIAAPLWAELSTYRLVFGGAPMLVSFGCAVLAGLIALAQRNRVVGRHAAWIAAGFGATSVTIATVLGIAPPDWRGGWPEWPILFVLTFGVLGAFVAARYRQRLAGLLVGTVAAWHWTWLPLIAWIPPTGQPSLTLPAVPIWMVLVGTTLLVVAAGLRITRRISPTQQANEFVQFAGERWNTWAYGLTAAGGLAQWIVLAIGSREDLLRQWDAAAVLWLAVSGVAAAASTLAGRRDWLRLAILISLSAPLAVVTSIDGLHSWYLSQWLQPFAAWRLIACLVATAAAWWMLRGGIGWATRRWPADLALKDRAERVWASAADMPDGWMVWASTGLVGWIALQYVAPILLGPTLPAWPSVLTAWPSELSEAVSLPPAMSLAAWGVLLASGVITAAWRQRERVASTAYVLAVWAVTASTLIATQLAIAVSEHAVGRLIAMVMSAVVILALMTLDQTPVRIFGRFRNAGWLSGFIGPSRLRLRVAEAAIAIWIGLGSASLLIGQWVVPIFDEGIRPDGTSTLVVGAWWLTAAVAWLLAGRQSTARQVVSSLLVPAAIIVLVPLIGQRSVAAWVQWSVLGSVTWLLAAEYGLGILTRRWPVAACSWGFIAGIGLISGLLGYSPLIHDAPLTSDWTGAAGLLAAILAAGLGIWWLLPPVRWSWPVGLLWIGGQLAAALVDFNGAFRWEWVVATVWLAAAIGGAAGRVVHGTVLHTLVLAITSGGLFVLSVFGSDNLTIAGSLFALAGLTVLGAGLSTTGLSRPQRNSDATASQHSAVLGNRWGWSTRRLESFFASVALRLLGWFVLLGGFYLLLEGTVTGNRANLQWTTAASWLAFWCIAWRVSDRWMKSVRPTFRRLPLADSEAAWLLLPLTCLVMVVHWNSGGPSAPANVSVADLWSSGLWIASVSVLVACTAFLRPVAKAVWQNSLLLLTSALGLIATIAMQVTTIGGQVTPAIAAAVAGAFGILLWSGSFGHLIHLGNRRGWFVHSVTAPNNSISLGHQMATATGQVTLWLAVLATLLAVVISQSTEGLRQTQASLLTPALLACVFYQLSHQFGAMDLNAGVAADLIARRYRRRCVQLGLWTLALLAVLASPATPYPALMSTMRLLIVSVVALTALSLALPRLLSSHYRERWSDAFGHGSLCAAVTAGSSLVLMLLLEFGYRSAAEGLPELPLPIVIVVALVLGVLAIVAAVLAVLTFQPTDRKETSTSRQPRPRREWLGAWTDGKGWTDQKRQRCLIAAQLIAAATWGHQYLCRPQLATLGLRSAWPYLVMAIAFVSVGLQQWASRRGDRAIAQTMQRTALFLPMIPVVGFWLSGGWAALSGQAEWGWHFVGGVTGSGNLIPGVSYQGLLLFAACYYGMLSWMWKQQLPRVATVVLANAALWVTLTQLPGWSFLVHPQAWLIPPAACVLAVTHWYRHQLAQSTRSAIRYSGTLVIYISSTADMLLADIGTTLAGPMILILLALAGMLAGVALRVKPFLYLGTVFVFLGVTSMVWHAGQAIDAVWPWWVFGITMGVLLLTFLAMLERHRAKFQRWAEQLARWEGG